jgi:hypothetical protein
MKFLIAPFSPASRYFLRMVLISDIHLNICPQTALFFVIPQSLGRPNFMPMQTAGTILCLYTTVPRQPRFCQSRISSIRDFNL